MKNIEWDEIGLSIPDQGWTGSGPGETITAVIHAAIEATKSVPYSVSLRWVFYRLWQHGDLAHIPATVKLSKKENAYMRMKAICSKAVHYGMMRPDWIADDTRAGGGRGGYSTVNNWIDTIKEEECYLDWWKDQDTYVMIAYEAAAMAQQFEHYTSDFGVRHWPMRGDPSNPYKLRIAQITASMSIRYGKPVVILYFGDLDEKGLSIPEAAFRDVKEWCSKPFNVYRVGLNYGDEVKYDMQEIPGKPGSYQWEALTDPQADSIISDAIGKFVNNTKMIETKAEESKATDQLQTVLQDLSEEWED